ncbi:MAG: hypothetical protein AAGF83_24560 [Cyanobacteria bacterium P01_G01_bin.67]
MGQITNDYQFASGNSHVNLWLLNLLFLHVGQEFVGLQYLDK